MYVEHLRKCHWVSGTTQAVAAGTPACWRPHSPTLFWWWLCSVFLQVFVTELQFYMLLCFRSDVFWGICIPRCVVFHQGPPCATLMFMGTAQFQVLLLNVVRSWAWLMGLCARFYLCGFEVVHVEAVLMNVRPKCLKKRCFHHLLSQFFSKVGVYFIAFSLSIQIGIC